MEFEVLKRVMVDVLNVDASEISLDCSFEDDFGADSLDLYQVISGVEEELDIKFLPHEVEKIKTIREAVNLIESKVN
ncbi:MAG: acyl carrier protein [Lachnospiraceae bacterium]|nr:acyl carrier protein [Lachnospiraceae bacterium]